ncbi:hypothetical protein CVT25_006986 [Psilocybe cyanescens]|uniref:Major facilitator superfamily (MFS) profile domain-containing protein n=1 Tax=Psilocybe cyanescens TaxID=93625 RepID=A0A409WYD3_PSICY|nr:hypothetical protein CVT25_006986 [Psilocybe cyanescens]
MTYPLEMIATTLEFDNSKECPQRSIVHKDEALVVLSLDSTIERPIDPEEDARLVRKIDRHLMPIMFCIYFLQLVDKHTLSFSSVFGLSRDADLVGDDYSFLGSIVYIAQLVMQPLSAYLLVKFRLSIYVPVIVTCWGATLLCMAAARNFMGLLIARFFLGAFEASVQASFILVVQFWYRRQEQGFRFAAWYSNVGWVNIFGSLIMFGLGHIQSGVLFTYQMVFLLLGAITFIIGIISFKIFPDNPVRSSFLTAEEKIMAVERIRANQQGLETKKFKMRQVLEMFLDLKSWCWMLLMLATALPGSGIAAEIIDYSMITTEEVEWKWRNYAEKNGDTSRIAGARAFDDMTDLENDEFIVSDLITECGSNELI